MQQRSNLGLHLVGYTLLLLTLFDFVAILVPPDLTNPYWELQTIGDFVERVPIPLLGFVLVFYRTQGQIGRREAYLMQLLSRLALLLGLLYLAMVPLGAINTQRVHTEEKIAIQNQAASQLESIERVQTQLAQAQSRSQIQTVILNTILNTPIQESEIQMQDPQQAKQRVLERLQQRQQALQQQSAQDQQQRKRELLKKGIKWNLGALLSGLVFLWIWRLTRWVGQLRFR